MEQLAINIAIKAYENHAFDALLLEREGYCYLPPSSPSNSRSDLVLLINAIYDFLPIDILESAHRDYINALRLLALDREGLSAVFCGLFLEVYRWNERENFLGFDVEEIARCASKTALENMPHLMQDFAGQGFGWPNGKWDEINNITRAIHDLGGPLIELRRLR